MIAMYITVYNEVDSDLNLFLLVKYMFVQFEAYKNLKKCGCIP